MLEYNLEEGRPFVYEALAMIEFRLGQIKKGSIIVIIHGYGSSGKGGKIRGAVRSWLKEQLQYQTVKTVVYGENFDMFDADSRELHRKDPQLAKYYGRRNKGITIVEK